MSSQIGGVGKEGLEYILGTAGALTAAGGAYFLGADLAASTGSAIAGYCAGHYGARQLAHQADPEHKTKPRPKPILSPLAFLLPVAAVYLTTENYALTTLMAIVSGWGTLLINDTKRQAEREKERRSRNYSSPV